ncbi:hypothetical protein M422DRAFT_262249 [Sphaerobolus stellatus SS14]|uniref:Uncharacterized protein n=1 Tax=Sphaerobolus stellatus (strain SS14) TaxID=990650 RepID=A0A0C9UKU0_SPHS4|nr:hypothetical protein M422DRAFT_262249 [Sphaerobolus stellatus SS14]
MAPKKKTSDKVPAGTSDSVDSGSTTNITGGNDLTMDPGKDPNQMVSAASETNTIHPTRQSTCVNNQLAQPSNGALEARTKALQAQLIAIREKYPSIAKGKSNDLPRNLPMDPYNEESYPHNK